MPNQFGPTFVYGTSQVLGPPASLGGSISPAQLVADTNDWNPAGLSGATVIRLSFDIADRSLTGLVGGSDGRVIILENIGTTSFFLVHDSTASVAANRFIVGGAVANATPTIGANNTVMLVYDGTSSRWRSVAVKSGSYLGMSGAVLPADLASVAAFGGSPFYSPSDHVHAFPSYAATSTYTPTLTQSGTVTKTVTYAHYWQIGKLVLFWVKLAVTGAGSAGTTIAIGLPVATSAGPPDVIIGNCAWQDTSTGTQYPGVVIPVSTTVVNLFRVDASYTDGMGVDPNLALASTDVLNTTGMYEAA